MTAWCDIYPIMPRARGGPTIIARSASSLHGNNTMSMGNTMQYMGMGNAMDNPMGSTVQYQATPTLKTHLKFACPGGNDGLQYQRAGQLYL